MQNAKSLIQQHNDLRISVQEGERIFNIAMKRAEEDSLKNGAPMNEKGEVEFDQDTLNVAGYSDFGIHMRDWMLKLLPDELVALSVRLYPEAHIGKWNHPVAVGECFWGAYVDDDVDVDELQAHSGLLEDK